MSIDRLEPRVLFSTYQIGGSPIVDAGIPYNLTLTTDSTTVSSWMVDWGDGTSGSPDAQTISGNLTSAQHVYSSNGSFTIAAAAVDGDGTYSSPNAYVEVIPPTESVSPSPTAGLNQPIILGYFGDLSSTQTVGNYSAVINWGDGNAPTAGSVIDSLNPNYRFEVMGNYTYSSEGNYTANVTITDSSNATTTLSSSFQVQPELAVTGNLTGVAGTLYTLNLSAGSLGTDTIHSWSINWGDGNTTNYTGAPTSEQHIYATTGSFSITASATDSLGTFLAFSPVGGAIQSVTIVPPVTASPATFALGEGGQADLGHIAGCYGTLSPSAFSVSINWGDGTGLDTSSGYVTSVTNGGTGLEIVGAHEYSASPTSQPTITLTATAGNTTITFNSNLNISVIGAPLIHIGESSVPTLSGNVNGTLTSALTFGSDGNAWYVDSVDNQIVRVNSNGTSQSFTISTTATDAQGLTLGADGNLWFVLPSESKIGRVTPLGNITLFSLSANPTKPVLGSNGNIWFIDSSNQHIGQITSNGTVQEFALPSGANNPDSLLARPDGRLWYVDSTDNLFGAITSNGTVSSYSVTTGSSGVSSAVVGSDGNIWFLEPNTGQLGMMTSNGTLSEFSVGENPTDLTLGANNTIWFLDAGTGSLDSISTDGSDMFASYVLPAGANFPDGLSADSKGNIWYADAVDNVIGEITPTGDFSSYTIPTGNSGACDAVTASDGTLWFMEPKWSKIGKITPNLSNAIDATTTQTFSNVTVGSFNDMNSNASTSDYTVVIHWGDGSQSNGMVVGSTSSSYSFDIQGSHTYSTAGLYNPFFTITAADGAAFMEQSLSMDGSGEMPAISGLGCTTSVMTGTVTSGYAMEISGTVQNKSWGPWNWSEPFPPNIYENIKVYLSGSGISIPISTVQVVFPSVVTNSNYSYAVEPFTYTLEPGTYSCGTQSVTVGLNGTYTVTFAYPSGFNSWTQFASAMVKTPTFNLSTAASTSMYLNATLSDPAAPNSQENITLTDHDVTIGHVATTILGNFTTQLNALNLAISKSPVANYQIASPNWLPGSTHVIELSVWDAKGQVQFNFPMIQTQTMDVPAGTFAQSGSDQFFLSAVAQNWNSTGFLNSNTKIGIYVDGVLKINSSTQPNGAFGWLINGAQFGMAPGSTHTITLSAYDQNGIGSVMLPGSQTVTMPVGTVNAVTQIGNATISGNANNGASSEVWLYVDGGLISQYAYPSQTGMYSSTFLGLTPGLHTVHVYAEIGYEGNSFLGDVPLYIPSVTASNGSYSAGSTVPIQIHFPTAVTVTGTPQLYLNTGGGGQGRYINYSNGSGSNTITFNYTVAPGDNSVRLDYFSNTSLNAPGLFQYGSPWTSAVFPAPGTPGSLEATSSITIDNIAPNAPQISSVNSQPASSVNSFNTISPTILLHGMGEVGSIITVTEAGQTASGIVAADGTWKALFPVTLSDGTYNFSAHQTDAAGNMSSNTTFIVNVSQSATSWSTLSTYAGVLVGSQASGALINWSPDIALPWVKSGDFNGDGRQDLVGVDGFGRWWVGLSNGTSGFSTQLWANVTNSQNWTNILVGDFNGDGLTDMAGIDSAGKLQLMLSTGSGFSAPIVLANASQMSGLTNLHIGDFNGDHRADIVARDGSGNWQVGISGNGTLTLQNWGNWGFTPSNIVVGDFTGDGRDDIAGQDGSGNWVVGQSSGTSFGKSTWATGFANMTDVHVADFDGDGKMDLVGRQPNSTTWSVLISTGSNFSAYTGNAGENLSNITIGDINGDGRADIIGKYTNGWHVLFMNPLGSSPLLTDSLWNSNISASITVANFSNMTQAALQAFQYVYNNITFTPYAGAVKGPAATDDTKAGNDVDQATLLIQKLAAAGLQARFATGQITPLIGDLQNWLGTTDYTATGTVLTAAGFAPSPANANTTYSFNHTWVQVYLAGPNGIGWYNLDPSWKFETFNTTSNDVLSNVPYQSTLVNGANGTVTLAGYLNQTIAGNTPLPSEWYADQVQNYLNNQTLRQSIADVSHTGTIIGKSFLSLPENSFASLSQGLPGQPYDISSVETVSPIVSGNTNPESVIADVSKQRVEVTLTVNGSPAIQFPVSMPDIGASTVVMDYTRNQNGTLSPELLINGTEVANTTMWFAAGSNVTLTLDTLQLGNSAVAGGDATYSFARTVGQVIGIGLDGNQWSDADFLALQAQLNQLALTATPGSAAEYTVQDEEAGMAAMQYFHELRQQYTNTLNLIQLIPVQSGIGSGTTTLNQLTGTSADFFWDLQDPVVSKMTLDNPNIKIRFSPLNGTLNLTSSRGQGVMALLGDTLSALENQTIENFTNANAVSTVKGLEYAAQNGIRIIQIPALTSSATILYDLPNLNSNATQAIINDVQAGFTVTVPVSEVVLGNTSYQFGSWNGVVWSRISQNGANLGEMIMKDGDTAAAGSYDYGQLFGSGTLEPVVDRVFGSPTVNDPVDPYTGALLHSETDITVANIGLPLTFTRNYNSLLTQSANAQPTAPVDEGMGLGWTYTFGDFLSFPDSQHVMWTTSDGQRRQFTLSNGNYTNDAGVFGTFTSQGSGNYTYTDVDGTIYHFTQGIDIFDDGVNISHLDYISDRNSNKIQLTYDNHNQFLSKVQGSADSLNFFWSNGHIYQIKTTLDSGRVWSYQYTRIGNTTQGATVLTEADSPVHLNQQLSTKYSYSTNAVLFGLLTGFTDGVTGATHQFSYYDNRRIFGVTDPLGNLERYTYDFMRNTTTYTDERGNTTVYEFNGNGTTTGVLTKLIAPDLSRTNYTWDQAKDEMLTMTDAIGRTETRTYDAKGGVSTDAGTDGVITAYTYGVFEQLASEATQIGPIHTVNGATYSSGNVTVNIANSGYSVGQTLQLSILNWFTGVVTVTDVNSSGFRFSSASLPNTSQTGTVYLAKWTQIGLNNNNGNALTKIDPAGKTTVMQYDSLGQMTSVTAPDGGGAIGAFTQYFYHNTSGQVTQQTRYDNATGLYDITNSYQYDLDGNRTWMQDAKGNTTTFVYDALGELLNSVTSPVPGAASGLTTSYSYVDGRKATEVDPNGNTTSYSYDLNGRLTQTTMAGGTFTAATYDALGNLISTRDADGNVTTYLYNGVNRQIETLNPDGSFVISQYDGAGRVVSSQTPLSIVTPYGLDQTASQSVIYDSGDRPIKSVDALQRTTLYSYDLLGNLLSKTNPNGNVIVDAYDALNRKISERDLEAAVSITGYVVSGSNATMSASNSYKTGDFVEISISSLGFSGLFQIISATSTSFTITILAGGLTGSQSGLSGTSNRRLAMTGYAYDADGNLTSMVQYTSLNGTTGNTTTYQYDQLDRKTLEIDPTPYSGAPQSAIPTTTFSYDKNNNLIKVIDPKLNTTQYQYDVLNRKTLEIDPVAFTGDQIPTISYSYDFDGNLTAVVDARLNTTNYVYDKLNRQIAVIGPTVSTGRATTSVAYDANGNRMQVTNPDNNATAYRYDSMNRQVMIVGSPASNGASESVSMMGYDAAGDLVLTMDPNQGLTINQYDAAHHKFEYDKISVYAAITWGVAYQLPSVAESLSIMNNFWINTPYPNFSTDDVSANYTYNLDGNLLTTTDPNQNTTQYKYDGLDRMTMTIQPAVSVNGVAANPTTSYAYDAVGNLTSMIDPKGNTTSYSYDGLNRKTRQVDALSHTTTYAYDVDGNMTSVVDPRNLTTQYQYDGLNRKTAEIDAAPYTGAAHPTTLFAYDKSGNLISVTDARSKVTQYVYDALGRKIQTIEPTVSSGTPTIIYSYDAAGNLTTVTDANTKVTAYFYDTLNRKTLEIDADPGTGSPRPTISYSYDLNGNLTQMIGANGGTTQYIYDQYNRKIEEIDPIPVAGIAAPTSSFSYDSDGNLTQVIDPRLNTTSYQYDALSRKTLEIDPAVNGVSATTSYAYDADNNLTQVIDPKMNTTTYSYDVLNRKTQESDGTGIATTSYVYDADGNLTRVIDPNQHTTVYVYDLLNRKTLESDGGQPVPTKFTYDADNNLVTLVDTNSHTSTYSYDGLNRKTQEIDGNGAITTGFVYDSNGNLVQRIDPKGLTTTFVYDALNRKFKEIDPTVAAGTPTTTWGYDAAGNLTSVTDPNGNVTQYFYDKLNRKTEELDADPGHGMARPTNTYFYDAAGNLTKEVDTSHTTTYQYDAMNRKCLEIDASPGFTMTTPTTSFIYDLDGNLSQVIDVVRNTSTAYRYDALNRKVARIDPAPNTSSAQPTTSYVYDAAGNLLNIVDPLLNTTTYAYDTLNRKTSEIDPSPDGSGNGRPTTTFHYDYVGNLTSVIGFDSYTINTYDTLNRLSTTNSAGRVTSYSYDLDGNVTKMVDPNGHTTQYQYDLLNRKTEVIGADPGNGLGSPTTIYAYDKVGNRISVTDPNTFTTYYSFDYLNREILKTDPAPYIPRSNPTTSYTYDAWGNQLTVTDPDGNTTTNVFDGLNRLRTTTTQTGTRTYAYDAEGNLIQSIDRDGRTINYGYDKLNRQTSETWVSSGTLAGSGNVISSTYDLDGRQLTTGDSYSTTTYTYDNLGEVTTEVSSRTHLSSGTSVSIANVTIINSYDQASERIGLTLTIGSTADLTNQYSFSNGLVYDITQAATTTAATYDSVNYKDVSLTYDGNKNLTEIDYSSPGYAPAAQSFRTFDALNRVTSINNQDAEQDMSDYEQNSYDLGSRLSNQTNSQGLTTDNSLTSPITTTFAYDNDNQLTSSTDGVNAPQNYSYDLNGNRNNTGNTFGPNNEIMYDGTYSYTYDAEGNLKTKVGNGDSLSFTYDYRNRLVKLTGYSQTSIYTYDTENRRIAQNVGGATTLNAQYVYDGENGSGVNNLLAVLDGSSGAVTQRYLTGPSQNQVFAQDVIGAQNDAVGWLLTDKVGSVADVVVYENDDQLSYDAFGNLISQSDPNYSPPQFHFTGYQLDPSGLHYANARYYDSTQGRFITQDPKGFAAGDTNLYRYVGNDPVNGTDPTGMDSLFGSSGSSSGFGSLNYTIPSSSLNAFDSGFASTPPPVLALGNSATIGSFTSSGSSFYEQSPLRAVTPATSITSIGSFGGPSASFSSSVASNNSSQFQSLTASTSTFPNWQTPLGGSDSFDLLSPLSIDNNDNNSFFGSQNSNYVSTFEPGMSLTGGLSSGNIESSSLQNPINAAIFDQEMKKAAGNASAAMRTSVQDTPFQAAFGSLLEDTTDWANNSWAGIKTITSGNTGVAVNQIQDNLADRYATIMLRDEDTSLSHGFALAAGDMSGVTPTLEWYNNIDLYSATPISDNNTRVNLTYDPLLQRGLFGFSGLALTVAGGSSTLSSLRAGPTGLGIGSLKGLGLSEALTYKGTGVTLGSLDVLNAGANPYEWSLGGIATQAGASSETFQSLSSLGNFSARNADSLRAFGPGAVFSGVYSPEVDDFLAWPSGNTRLLSGQNPVNLVPRNGGHAIVNQTFSAMTGSNPASNVGFTMFLENDGSISFEWTSGGVNGRFPGNSVPLDMRPPVMNKVQSVTGLPVSSK